MEQRLTFITLAVEDLDGMKHFYTHVFGWQPLKDDNGIVFFKLNGFILGLYPADELAGDIAIKPEGTGFKRFSLAVNFSSEKMVDEVFAELQQKGARVVCKPEKVFWGGYRGYIADPEDNYWEIAYNPFLEMDINGNVKGHE